MAEKVLAPMVQFRVEDPAGGWVLVQRYAGSPVPEQIHPDDRQRGLDEGWLVAEDEPVAERFAVPAGTPLPGQPPNVEVGLTGVSVTTAQPVPPLSQESLQAAELDVPAGAPYAAPETDAERVAREAQEAQSADGKPSGRASAEAWREYHVRQQVAAGMSEEDARVEADSLSRDDLRSRYAE
jgi:hypothetical protein